MTEKPQRETQAQRAMNQLKMNVIRQVGNVLLKSLTAFLSRALGRYK